VHLFIVCPAPSAAVCAADEARQAAAAEQPAAGSQPYYMKQTIGNACGTIAMLHAIGNNPQHAGIGAGGGRVQLYVQSSTVSMVQGNIPLAECQALYKHASEPHQLVDVFQWWVHSRHCLRPVSKALIRPSCPFPTLSHTHVLPVVVQRLVPSLSASLLPLAP
jgi:hypothetical protein